MSPPIFLLDPQRLAAVRLEEAHLCQDCNLITAAAGGSCTCGSQAVMRLAPILNPELKKCPGAERSSRAS
jgi:hypothetical protein